MKQKKDQGVVRRLIASRVLLVLELGIIIVFSVALTKEIIRRWEVRQEINKLETEIAELEQSNTEIAGLISYFQSDYYKEKEARLKLGLQKEGESALTIPIIGGTGAELNNLDEAQSSKNQGLGMPQKWWNYFFANNE
ncbi:septum formation initiator family protein [Patescibacteria group bacterium]|nr:septum formation initiator family protein [Patescibacteria group bacterium]MBU1889910.1 septum formation initiator family protein [Patescibacteria group bacterium]